MKHFRCIFLLIFSYLWPNTETIDVKHLIVDHDGHTIECYVDSMGFQYIYFVPEDSIDVDSTKLKSVYYVFNDYDKVFYHSWSFVENIRRMDNRSGKVFTIHGDTIEFSNINFNMDMINPEIFLKTGPEKSQYLSMFDIEKIETDFSIMSYSVKRGFQYSFYSFLLAATIEIAASWDKETRATTQIWDQYNDLLPKISILGINKQKGNGVAYESFTSMIPLTILISMAYDIYKEKNKFYFNPIYKDKVFGRNMYVFSIKQIVKSGFTELVFLLEKNKLGKKVVGWFR